MAMNRSYATPGMAAGTLGVGSVRPADGSSGACQPHAQEAQNDAQATAIEPDGHFIDTISFS